MPILTISAIYSFSSEDDSFPAANLLSSTTSTGKKWKSNLTGEPSIHVILQLEKSSMITGIDIGNEHSAFIEVLVAKNGSSNFKQLLLASSFMSPMESRNSDPVNRVRCFSRSALDESVIESKCKWNLVKVICTQPFNKHVQYGLSFIKLHSPVDTIEEKASSLHLPVPSKLFGNFKIREESPDSENESQHSLFARWKMARNSDAKKEIAHASTSISAAAAIRNASSEKSLKNYSSPVNKTTIATKRKESNFNASDQQDDDEMATKTNRNRLALIYEHEDDAPNDKLDKIILKEKEKLEREKNIKKISEEKNNNKNSRSLDVTKKVKNILDNDSASSSSVSTWQVSKENSTKPSANNENAKLVKKIDSPAAPTSRNKRHSSPPSTPVVKRMKETKEQVYKPFYKLLEGVVLVISGIQNPTRATLRQQALDMGAKYKPDWESSCTHLICAFKNTPKYNQGQGHGKIVTKNWIAECHKKKMRLPWRRFALDGNDAAASESEDEIYDNSLKPSQTSSQHSNKGNSNTPAEQNPQETQPTSSKKLSPTKLQSHTTSPSKISKSPNKSPKVLSDSPSDDESIDHYNLNSSRTDRNEFVSSGSDTEDEIRRVLDKNTSSAKVQRKRISSDDIYNVSTEEESNVINRNSTVLTPLPEFFKGKIFYLSRNISSTDDIKLKRFITIYGGELTHEAHRSDYIVSNSSKQTPPDYKGEIVKPLWIFECNDLEMLLPTKRYNFSNW